jgi:hypothetical protein
VSDDNAVKVIGQSKEFDNFNEKGSEIADKFLAELKSKSQIIYR